MAMAEWTMVTTSNMVFNQVFASSALFDQTYGIRRLGPTIVPDTTTGVFTLRDSPHPNPISGNGSLLIRALSSLETGHNYRIYPGQRGWNEGAITSQWYVAATTADKGFGFGYYCFANQLDIRTSGRFYLIGCADNQGNNLSIYNIYLSKVTSNGLLGYTSTANILVQASPNVWPLQSRFSLRVTWTQTVSGLHFRIFTGTAVDYSDMVEILSYSDSAPLSATLAEGFWGAAQSSTSLKVYTDATEFFKGAYSA